MNNISGMDYNEDLEIKIGDMCGYLDKLVMDEEVNPHVGPAACGAIADTKSDIFYSTYNAAYYTGVPIQYNFHIPQMPQNPVNLPLYKYDQPSVYSQNASNNLTSVLATASTSNTKATRFSEPSHFTRHKKWVNYNKPEKDPDTSHIDIDATMIELGLTPESLTQNEVYKVFSLYKDLDFAIHADYMSNSIYDKTNLPNTMSVASQTKYIVWRCHTLLRDLRDVLKRPMPSEYLPEFTECNHELDELLRAIIKLHSFRHCSLEHRKGGFVSQEAKEYLEPLMDALKHLIECVKKSRMYVQVYERALNAPEKYKPPLQIVCEEKPQPLPHPSSVAFEHGKGRPLTARRYIG